MKRIYIVTILGLFGCIVNAQNLIRNGGFEEWDRQSYTSPNLKSPQCPEDHGGFSKSNDYYVWHWYGDRFANGGSNQNHPVLFDSRWDCSDSNFVDTIVSGYPDVCGNEMTSHGNLGIPGNFLGNQGHRLPIDGFEVVGRYAGLFTSAFSNHVIKTQMIEPLSCGVAYDFEFYAVNKGGSSLTAHVRFSETGNWNDPIPYNASGHVDYDVEITETSSWQHVTGQFNFPSPSNGNVWVMVSLSKSGLAKGKLFVDDFSMIKVPCNPNKQCSSTTDCIDVQVLDHVSQAGHSSLVFNGLEEVTNLNLNIYALNGQLIRNYNIDNPAYSWEWDGVNQYGGTLSSATYSYDYTLSNDCQSVSGSGTTVKINLGNRIFNVYAGDSEAGLTFYNLDNVQDMTLEILTTSGALLHTETFVNPPNILAWNGLYNNGNHPAPGNYKWRLTVSNNCGSAEFSDNFSFIDFSEPHILHDHAPISKPAMYNCGDDKDYSIYERDYDRAPLPCCEFEPDIYLDNVNIWYDTKYKATNNITIGDNVRVIGDNSGVLFQAGNSITVLPGAEIADATLLELTYCVKSATYNGDDESDYSEAIEIKERSMPKQVATVHSESYLYPNPASESFTINIVSKEKGFDLKIIDIHGKNVLKEKFTSNLKTIDTSGWSKGIYICEISYDDIVDVKKMIITK